jgi:hypothetical protein
MCLPLVVQGAPCATKADCASNNCGVPAALQGGATDADASDGSAANDAATGRQCLVAAGAPCTSQNCGACGSIDGSAVCAQSP